jgi:hypothetical protein
VGSTGGRDIGSSIGVCVALVMADLGEREKKSLVMLMGADGWVGNLTSQGKVVGRSDDWVGLVGGWTRSADGKARHGKEAMMTCVGRVNFLLEIVFV